MNDETKALVEKSFRDVLEQHMQGFEAHIQGQVAEAVRMLKERQEAENIFYGRILMPSLLLPVKMQEYTMIPWLPFSGKIQRRFLNPA